jgi:hypothetical protein
MFGHGQQLGRALADVQVETAFLAVVFRTEPPVARLLRERIGQVAVEIAERLQGRYGRCVVGGPELRWGGGAQRLVDELDVAVILFARDAVPYLGRVEQIGPGLRNQRRHALQALDDVPEPLLPGGGVVGA